MARGGRGGASGKVYKPGKLGGPPPSTTSGTTGASARPAGGTRGANFATTKGGK